MNYVQLAIFYNVEKKYFKSTFSGHRKESIIKNIANGTTDPRVEFISQVQTQILIKFDLQNLDQASTSKFQANISILTKLKIQNLVHNLDQDSTS